MTPSYKIVNLCSLNSTTLCQSWKLATVKAAVMACSDLYLYTKKQKLCKMEPSCDFKDLGYEVADFYILPWHDAILREAYNHYKEHP